MLRISWVCMRRSWMEGVTCLVTIGRWCDGAAIRWKKQKADGGTLTHNKGTGDRGQGPGSDPRSPTPERLLKERGLPRRGLGPGAAQGSGGGRRANDLSS